MYQEYAEASAKVAPFVCDTAALLNQALVDGESVFFEGAQGTMLDIDHGTYPFVTSSSATSGGAVIGTGVAPTAIDPSSGSRRPIALASAADRSLPKLWTTAATCCGRGAMSTAR